MIQHDKKFRAAGLEIAKILLVFEYALKMKILFYTK